MSSNLLKNRVLCALSLITVVLKHAQQAVNIAYYVGPFLELNDIAVRSAKKHIIIKGKDVVPYASTVAFKHPSTRRIKTYSLVHNNVNMVEKY